jgi:hypothetical protein
MGVKGMFTEFLWGNLKERNHLQDLRVNVILKNEYGGTWTGVIWLRTGINGEF